MDGHPIYSHMANIYGEMKKTLPHKSLYSNRCSITGAQQIHVAL